MLKYIAQTIFYLIVSPRKGWERIMDKNMEHQKFIGDFLFPIFGFIAITTLAGALWMVENSRIHDALKQTIVIVSALFAGFYLASYLLNELFPKYGLEKKLSQSQQFVGYSSVLLYILFFVMPLLPGFSILWITVIYTLYIVFAGCGEFLDVKRNKRLNFTVISSLLIVLAPMLIKTLLELLMSLLPN